MFHTWLLDLYYLWARSSCHIWISVKARSWIQKSLTLKRKCWNVVPHMCCSDFFFSVTKCQRRQLKEERIYLGSWFQRFQSVISELHCCDPVERQSVTTEKRESKRYGEADLCNSQSAGKRKRIGAIIPGMQCIFQRHSPRELRSLKSLIEDISFTITNVLMVWINQHIDLFANLGYPITFQRSIYYSTLAI